MVFNVWIKVDRKLITLKVERVYLSNEVERYRVSARNKNLIIQSNRPLLKGKGLKNRRPNWKLIEGQLQNSYVLQKIIEEIEAYVTQSEK